MRDNTGFFETHEDPGRGWMLINYPIKLLCGTEVKINCKEYKKTPGIQIVFTDKSYKTAKSMNDMEKSNLRDTLQKLMIISVHQKKDVCQVVMDILKMILIRK